MSDVAAVESEIEETLQALDPKYEAKTWVVVDKFDGDDGVARAIEREYIQRPLSYWGKIELFGLLGRAVERALKDEGGMTVAGLMQTANEVTDEKADFDTFVGALAHLSQYVPTIMMDTYMLSLHVPRGERDWVAGVWETEMSDDDGLEILEIFIEQNFEALRSFFVEKAPKLVNRAKKLLGLDASVSSKPSKPTAARTRKR